VESVILDAGGLLYYRRKDSLSVLRDVIRRITGVGFELDKEHLLFIHELRELSFRGFISRRDEVHLFLKYLGVEGDDIADKVYSVYNKEMANNIVFYRDVPETLKALKKAGYKLAVLSNSSYTSREKLEWFARAGLKGVFEAVVCSCDIGYCKPEIRAYLTVLDRLGSSPGESFFVGHSVKDLVGAKKTGLKTIGVKCPVRDKEIADVFVPKLADLLKVLNYNQASF